MGAARWLPLVGLALALAPPSPAAAADDTSPGLLVVRSLEDEDERDLTLESVAVPTGTVTILHDLGRFDEHESGPDLQLSPDGETLAWRDGAQVRVGPLSSLPPPVILTLPDDDSEFRGMVWAPDGSGFAIATRTRLDEVDFDGPSLYRLWIWQPGRELFETEFRNGRFISLRAIDPPNQHLYWDEPVDGGGWFNLTRFNYVTGEKIRVGRGGPARRATPAFSRDLRYAFWAEAPPGDFTYSMTRVRRFDFTTGQARTIWTLPGTDDPERTIYDVGLLSADELLIRSSGRAYARDDLTLVDLDGRNERTFSFGRGWCHLPSQPSPDGRYVWAGYPGECRNGASYGVFDRTVDEMVTTLEVPRYRSGEPAGHLHPLGWIRARTEAAPEHDDAFERARTISLPFTGDVEVAENGLDPVAEMITQRCVLPERTRWLRFAVTETAPVLIDIAGTDPGLGLMLVSGTEPGALTRVACIEDATRGPQPPATRYRRSDRGTALVTLEAGREYHALIALCRRCGAYHRELAVTARVSFQTFGSIAGTITGCDGATLGPTHLIVYDEAGEEFDTGTASATGTYSLTVPPGAYTLRAGPAPRQIARAEPGSEAPLVRWHPDALGENRAEPIDVAAGATADADVVMCPIPAPDAGGGVTGPILAITLPSLAALAWLASARRRRPHPLART